MFTEEFKIKSHDESICVSVDYASCNDVPSVISIHGGGPSDKNNTRYLSSIFTERGESVIRFSHSGHGNSTGKIENSSLKKRYNEVLSVLEYFGIKKPLTVIGTSMGGYIASVLHGKYSIDTLILFCPAAYSYRAWDKVFSDGFTSVIREENSFMETDIPDKLENFTGKAMLLIGANDEIIPDKVTEIYLSSLKNVDKFELFNIEKCPHPIHRWAFINQCEDKIIKRLERFLC